MTRVVNKYLEPYDFYGGRGSFLGNQFVIGVDGDRDEVCDKFEVYFLERVKNDPEFAKAVLALRGKTLGCFCRPKRCHLDTVVKWIEAN